MPLVGIVLGVVAWLWLRTLRLVVLEHPALAAVRDRPWVLCFHHGRQFPLLAWKRRGETVVLVSHSRDGSMQARALSLLGLVVVRGSSSRGGARGLAALVRAMRTRRADAAFAIDGPRGPLGVVKEGAIVAARASGAVLVPLGSAAARTHVLTRAWDRFAIAHPFSRNAVVLGAPIEPAAPTAREALERAILAANEAAEAYIGAARNAPIAETLRSDTEPCENRRLDPAFEQSRGRTVETF